MKLKFFTLLLLSAICFVSCRKIANDPDIKQYDQLQIQNYIAANGISGMVRDTAGGDTTGTYYKIITPGTGARVDYPSIVSYVYTLRSFDGKYAITDTVVNHSYGVLGHILPNGLMLAIRNDLKNLGGQMRVLIPSHLAYGKNGYVQGGGSTTIANGRIAGNQGLDITVNLIADETAYDQLVIKNYMAANNLSGYTETSDGLWYKITTPGTGATIYDDSSITLNYTLYLMNNTNPDANMYASTNTYLINDLSIQVNGFVEGLKLLGKGGGAISIIVPSNLAYGTTSTGGIPSNACLRWDISNITVTNQ